MKYVSYIVIVIAVVSSSVYLTSCRSEYHKRYTVSFYTGSNATIVDPLTVYEGEKVKKPENPSRPGYAFADWYREVGTVNPWDFETDLVIDNITLYAKWNVVEPTKFTVSFHTGDNAIAFEPQVIDEGGKVKKPETPTRAGYNFADWFKETAFVNMWDFENDVVHADITLYAKWDEIPVPKEVTVTFHVGNFPATVEPQIVLPGEKISMPEEVERNGFTFDAWYKDEETINKWDFENDVVNNHITLYAKWIMNDYVTNHEEQVLYDLIMEYRREYGLHKIPLSKSLGYVAQVHAKDLQERFVKDDGCMPHSWSEWGDWTSCCYSSDHVLIDCMRLKPIELTSYTGHGYEIFVWSATTTLTAQDYLDSWKRSVIHNALILNQNEWVGFRWNAIGVAIYKNYAVVWFGEEEDE